MTDEEISKHNANAPRKEIICPGCKQKGTAIHDKDEEHPAYMLCTACGKGFLA
jgi:hypothetical protein